MYGIMEDLFGRDGGRQYIDREKALDRKNPFHT